MFKYRRATLKDLNTIWDKDIKTHLKDERYIKWKKEFIEANIKEDIITFVVLNNSDPIAQCSLVLNKNNIEFKCREQLLKNKETAYICALRIEKRFEGQGHISTLMKTVEDFAKKKGFSNLTIGCEAKESRNLAIYLHWGYTHFVTSEIDNNTLVLFYKKAL